MSTSYSIERDLKEISKMGDAIGKYIPGDELYVSVSGGLFGGRDFPQLTIGAFLMRMRRLNYFRSEMSSVQQATLDKAIAQYEEARKEWAVHFEKKVNREVSSRLKMMQSFFHECKDNMRTCASAYPVEAMRRTVVQEVILAMKDYGLDTHEAVTASHQIDGELRRWVTAGDFIWSDMLEPVYARDTFWWLYGSPDASDS